MIVVEFDLQFLFVVSIKFFRKISQTSGLSGADPPRFWPFYWKQSDFDSQLKWHLLFFWGGGGHAQAAPALLKYKNK